MISQHTPTPWEVIHGTSYLDEQPSWMIPGVAHCGDGELSKANATFIARAVNEYDNNQVVIGKLTKEIDHLEHSNKALLEAAKELLLCCDTRFSASNITGPVVDRMYKAIAQAEGKL